MNKLNMTQIAFIIGVVSISIGVGLTSTVGFGLFTFGAALLFLAPVIFAIFGDD